MIISVSYFRNMADDTACDFANLFFTKICENRFAKDSVTKSDNAETE